MSYQITEEQKKILLQYSAQTLPDNPSRDGFSAEAIRKRMYKPTEKLVDLVNAVFDTVYTDVQSILSDIQNGDFFARSIASWSASYNYGANEITFYPSIGTYGAFVQSVVAGNTNNAPYVEGVLNSAYWKEVVNFNTVTEEYFQQIQEAVAQAENAATEAESSASAAANSATQAGIQNSNAQAAAFNASQSAQAAENSATAASTSAAQAASSATQSQNSAEQSGNYAGNAQTSAQNAADSATAAQQYAEQAQQYAQKHYQIVASVSALPRPGDSAFIYLVPTGSGTSNDSYSEYLWITESNDYEFIGTTADIDLSNYAQINGTYAGMTVGNATNAQTATNAQQLGGVAAANYAQTNGTYSGMTVGNATQAQNAATATDSEKLGGVLADKYALKTGTYSGMTVGNATNATNADTADSATSAQDSAKLGGVAASQYALQAQLPVANPTATGTQDLTSLQVGGTVYNIPQGGAVEYATDEEIDALFGSAEPQDELIGTWVFNDNADCTTAYTFNISFSCSAFPSTNFTGITVTSSDRFGPWNVFYNYSGGTETVYNGTSSTAGTWINTAYKTIQITGVSDLTNREAFETWLKANATKQ